MDDDDEPYPVVKTWDAKRGYHVWVETMPDECPNGHPWAEPGSVHIGHVTCRQHDGHREWTCRTCDAAIVNRPADAECAR